MRTHIKQLFLNTLFAQRLTPNKLAVVAACFLVMLVLAWSSEFLIMPFQHPILAASMGASAVLLFVFPSSPLAQPYAFIMGHLAPALVGVACAQWLDSVALGAAFAVSLSLLAMYWLDCLHPPGGAASLVPVISESHQALGFEYLLHPVLINVGIMLILAFVVNRYILRHNYPVKAAPVTDTVHKHRDPSPLARLGISADDLRAVLLEHNAYLDVSEAELFTLYNMAQMRAYTRKFGEVSVADIMSRDVACVAPDAALEDAWALLRYHKVKVLPVINTDREVVGVVSLIDFLKRADLKQYQDFAERLVELVRPHADAVGVPRCVADIMASPVFTVHQEERIATLVPLLSDKGLHHIPVVDHQQQLVGIVTQSDLIAALYSAGMSSATQPDAISA